MEVPLLFPVKTFEKLLPSVEVDMAKLYWREPPSAQAISTLHTEVERVIGPPLCVKVVIYSICRYKCNLIAASCCASDGQVVSARR